MASSELVLGYIGALVASVFFGSNYVPTKNYPTGDGMSFVWVFSSGVMVVGIFSIFICGKATFIFTGLIGGSLWATGNLCVIPIVKLIGLGLGLLLWGSASLITGFFTGKLGLFGLHKDHISHVGMNWAGILCIIGAMGVFFFIKPTLEDKEDRQPLLPNESGNIQGAPDKSEKTMWDRLPEKSKPLIGVLLAVGSGILYGVNMVPMSLWVQSLPKDAHPKPLEFVLSHFTGIYLYSTAVFLAYCIFRRPPQIFAESLLPSFLSGAMWGIAQCGLMVATNILGYTTGFPIGSTGPLIVSSLWSVLYFREIRGMKNLGLLGGSLGLLIAGILLLAKSH